MGLGAPGAVLQLARGRAQEACPRGSSAVLRRATGHLPVFRPAYLQLATGIGAALSRSARAGGFVADDRLGQGGGQRRDDPAVRARDLPSGSRPSNVRETADISRRHTAESV